MSTNPQVRKAKYIVGHTAYPESSINRPHYCYTIREVYRELRKRGASVPMARLALKSVQRGSFTTCNIGQYGVVETQLLVRR